MADFERQRERMVERQLRRRGIGDERVLAAMAAVPRELFVPEEHRRRAYADGALPIGAGQTISQPWIVAAICEGLELAGSELVLEIGTGSGYSACVLARLAAEVISVERHLELADRARSVIAAVCPGSIEVRVGDGSRGASDSAPFDAIAVHATAPGPPPSLLGQLAIGGRLVIPVSEPRADMLTTFRRLGEHFDPVSGEGLERTLIAPARFVPLVGDEGFAAE
jgi:protein-L-isoaspartate(D-aspartate) O-methyltransferase